MSDQQSKQVPWLIDGTTVHQDVPGAPFAQVRWTTEVEGALALAARIHRLLVEDDARIALSHVDDGRTEGRR